MTNSSSIKPSSLISIKGHPKAQSLPQSLVSNWKCWTFDSSSKTLTSVENEVEDGWINPTSFNQLFLPSDLPLPHVVIIITVFIKVNCYVIINNFC